MPSKYIKVLSNIFLRNSHTDPRCNMLQTLERRRKYIGVISSDENTLWSQFRFTNPGFLLTDPIILSKTNPCRGSMSKKGNNGENKNNINNFVIYSRSICNATKHYSSVLLQVKDLKKTKKKKHIATSFPIAYFVVRR